MSTPEQMEASWAAKGEQGLELMQLFLSRIDLAVAQSKVDGLASWAIEQGLRKTADKLSIKDES